jgi:hypothetical protein
MHGWYCSHCGKERGQLAWHDAAKLPIAAPIG